MLAAATFSMPWCSPFTAQTWQTARSGISAPAHAGIARIIRIAVTRTDRTVVFMQALSESRV